MDWLALGEKCLIPLRCCGLLIVDPTQLDDDTQARRPRSVKHREPYSKIFSYFLGLLRDTCYQRRRPVYPLLLVVSRSGGCRTAFPQSNETKETVGGRSYGNESGDEDQKSYEDARGLRD